MTEFNTPHEANKAMVAAILADFGNPETGNFGVVKDGTSGMFHVKQFPKNIPGVDTSCVDCGGSHGETRPCPRST